MPVAPTYPGVYIEEIPSGVRTITGVATFDHRIRRLYGPRPGKQSHTHLELWRFRTCSRRIAPRQRT